MTEKLKSKCVPCPEPVEFIPQAINPICPVKEKPDLTNSHLYPTSTYLEVEENCLKEMLTNMVTKKYCTIPPAGCGK